MRRKGRPAGPEWDRRHPVRVYAREDAWTRAEALAEQMGLSRSQVVDLCMMVAPLELLQAEQERVAAAREAWDRARLY